MELSLSSHLQELLDVYDSLPEKEEDLDLFRVLARAFERPLDENFGDHILDVPGRLQRAYQMLSDFFQEFGEMRRKLLTRNVLLLIDRELGESEAASQAKELNRRCKDWVERLSLDCQRLGAALFHASNEWLPLESGIKPCPGLCWFAMPKLLNKLILRLSSNLLGTQMSKVALKAVRWVMLLPQSEDLPQLERAGYEMTDFCLEMATMQFAFGHCLLACGKKRESEGAFSLCLDLLDAWRDDNAIDEAWVMMFGCSTWGISRVLAPFAEVEKLESRYSSYFDRVSEFRRQKQKNKTLFNDGEDTNFRVALDIVSNGIEQLLKDAKKRVVSGYIELDTVVENDDGDMGDDDMKERKTFNEVRLFCQQASEARRVHQMHGPLKILDNHIQIMQEVSTSGGASVYLDVEFLRQLWEASEAVCGIYDCTTKQVVATGWLASGGYIFTNVHVIWPEYKLGGHGAWWKDASSVWDSHLLDEKKKAFCMSKRFECWFRYDVRGMQDEAKVLKVPIYCPAEEIVMLPRLDVAIFKLEGISSLKGLKLRRAVFVDHELRPRCFIVGHPHVRNGEGRVETYKRISMQKEKFVFAKDADFVRYFTDTEKGNSGSPCFLWDTEDQQLAVFAIHHTGVLHGANDGSKTFGYNEGTLVSSILMELKRVVLDHPLLADFV